MSGAPINPVRIGVLGAGKWGRNLITDLVSAGAQVTSVDPCAEARTLAKKAGAKLSLQHLDQAGEQHGLIVATPTHLHFDSVCQALEYQVPVFCEKPLTTRLSRAEELFQLGGKYLFALEKWRYHPAIERLAQLVRSGQLGTIKSILTWRLSNGTPQNDVDPVWTLAPHDLSIARHIAGFIPPLSVVYPEWDRYRMVGVKAVFEDEFRVTIEVSAKREEYRRCVEINGTHGTARFDLDLPTRIELHDQEGTIKSIVVPDTFPTSLQMQAVMQYLQGGVEPFSSASEGVETVRIIENFYQLSCKTVAEEM